MEQQYNPSLVCFSDAHAAEMGENLQEIRRRRGLTQEDLAGRMYTDTRNIARYESGKSLTLPNLILLCQLLGCTFEDILPADFTRLASGLSNALSVMNPGALTAFSTAFEKERIRREKEAVA